jgi:hypothetical protein
MTKQTLIDHIIVPRCNNVVYQSVISRMLLTMSSWYNNMVYQSVISRMLLTMSSWYNNVVYQSVISRVTYQL